MDDGQVLAVEWAPAAGPTGGGKPTLYVLTKSNTIFHLTVEGKLLKTSAGPAGRICALKQCRCAKVPSCAT